MRTKGITHIKTGGETGNLISRTVVFDKNASLLLVKEMGDKIICLDPKNVAYETPKEAKKTRHPVLMNIREYPALGQSSLEAFRVNKMGVSLIQSGGVDIFKASVIPTRIDEEISVNCGGKIALGFPSGMKNFLSVWLANYAVGFKGNLQYLASHITEAVRQIVRFKLDAHTDKFMSNSDISFVHHNKKDGAYHFQFYPEAKNREKFDTFIFGYSGHGIINATLTTPVSLQILDLKAISNSINVNSHTPGNEFTTI